MNQIGVPVHSLVPLAEVVCPATHFSLANISLDKYDLEARHSYCTTVTKDILWSEKNICSVVGTPQLVG